MVLYSHGAASFSNPRGLKRHQEGVDTMQDTELIHHLLGLSEPWSVERVELNLGDRRLDIWATHATGVTWSCPECSVASPTRDHAAERLWRHLDSCQFETYIHARIPRVACAEHGVRQILVPWAEPDSRFTKQFERLAVGILAECRVSGTAAVLGLSWDEAQGMRERAARRREARKSAKLSEGRTAGEGFSRIESGEVFAAPSNGSEAHPHVRTSNGRSSNGNGAKPARPSQASGKTQASGHSQCQQGISRPRKLHRRAG